MPVELLTVTEVAKEFLHRAGHLFSRLSSAQFDQSKNQWVLQFDVGAITPMIKKITVDSAGKVVSFE